MNTPEQRQPLYGEINFQQFLLAQLEELNKKTNTLTYKIGRLEKHLIPPPLSEMEKLKGEFFTINDPLKGKGKITCTDVVQTIGIGGHEWIVEYVYSYEYTSPTGDRTIQHGCKTCDFNAQLMKNLLYISWVEWSENNVDLPF